jgi:transposase
LAGDAGELLAGQLTRILRRQSPILAEDQSPRPPFDIPILDEKGLHAGRLHAHSEASELAIPGEYIPTLIRAQRIDRPFGYLSHDLFLLSSSILVPKFASPDWQAEVGEARGKRWHYRDHFSIREISRRMGLSRNTVRKYLRSDNEEPKFSVPDRPSKLDPHADKLSHMLRQEAGKSRKQKRTIKQLHADLVVLGYEGSYNRVAAFARDWRAARQREQKTAGRGVFVPLAFMAGEAFQFDWSEDWAIIGGERSKLQVAHFKLSYSRAFVLRAYPQQTHEMLFDAHNHAFRVLGGVPRRGIYDNMRTAVDKVGRGKERQVNARFSAMVSHFLFEAEFCDPASGWEKGQIEKNVQDARHRLWQPTPCFPSLAALNDWLETRCRERWAQTPHGSHPGTISDAWSEEAQHLMPLPRLFDGFVEYAKRVSPTCLIHLERDRYSVPASFANRPVSVRVYPERIVVAGEGQVICEHRRVFARSHQRKSTTTVFDRRHYLAVIQRKSGALRNGAPFAELPPAFRALQQRSSRRPAAIARWSRSWRWFSSMRSRPCSRPSNWLWRPRADQDAHPEPAAPVD